MTLPPAFLSRPIAHRGLHDVGAGRAENSVKAVEAALAHGYGIELDVQLSKDGQAMVFHDYDLGRLTGEKGPVAQRTADELGNIPLLHDGDGVPTLSAILELVSGRTPLLIEIKDQDGAMGPNVGALEQATATCLAGYDGLAAVMSFNPHAVAKMAQLAPDRPRGLVTAAYTAEDWPTIPSATRAVLREIPDYERTGSCFISHDSTDLDRARVRDLKEQGASILCWTIKSPEAESSARRIVDNVTFEGYLA